MAETIDQLIFRADLALREKKFYDVKRYIEQAFKQVSDEKNDYIKTYASKNEEKKETIAQWYSMCGDIFFKVSILELDFLLYLLYISLRKRHGYTEVYGIPYIINIRVRIRET
jgi:hypothetical protein